MKTHGLENSLVVGLDVFLDPQPGVQNAQRFPGQIRGWEIGRYILLGFPQGAGMPAVRRGKECVVRFMYEGEVWGFTALCGESSTHADFPLVQLHWPREVARIQVRKHDRVAIQIPCTLHLDDEKTEHGTISDISGGGCSMVAHCELSVGQSVSLSFRMPEGLQVSKRPILVRNKRAEGAGAFKYGCQFQEVVEEDRGIERFVARKKASTRGESTPHNQLIIVSANVEDHKIAQQGLSESPYEVIPSSGLLDLGYQMYTCNPVGILISNEQKPLSAIDLLPLIQQSTGMEEIPLFLYGGGEELRHQAKSMGATLCIEFLTSIQEIIPHLPAVEEPAAPVEEPDDETPKDTDAPTASGTSDAPEETETPLGDGMESVDDDDDDDDEDDGDDEIELA